MKAQPFLIRERESIIGAAEHALRGRYAGEDAREKRHRLETLYGLIVESVDNRELGLLVAYTQKIARDRFNSAYDLSEVQTAFNVLEEATWRRIFEALPPAEWEESLGLVSTAFGAAKDALGREWISLATDAHVASLDVRALFAGTDRAVAP